VKNNVSLTLQANQGVKRENLSTIYSGLSDILGLVPFTSITSVRNISSFVPLRRYHSPSHDINYSQYMLHILVAVYIA